MDCILMQGADNDPYAASIDRNCSSIIKILRDNRRIDVDDTSDSNSVAIATTVALFYSISNQINTKHE